ncbi:hypothetical protein GCM10010278_73950 [Streptomyces melanogenes]|nr:hypothetical protein GCM10010278_73950 [Streptomyces melanogenes]
MLSLRGGGPWPMTPSRPGAALGLTRTRGQSYRIPRAHTVVVTDRVALPGAGFREEGVVGTVTREKAGDSSPTAVPAVSELELIALDCDRALGGLRPSAGPGGARPPGRGHDRPW